MLTGSASKGKMGNYYYYYHCSSACGTRFKAEPVNEAFVKQLGYLSPKEGMVDVFIEAFIKDFNNQNKIQNTQRANIIDEINTLNKRYQNALLKNADGEMADDDFQEVKKLTKGKIEDLETKLNDLAVVGTEIKDLVASALKKVANIDRRYENGDIEEKRAIIGSMFPEFLEFDGTQHRTARLNSAIALKNTADPQLLVLILLIQSRNHEPKTIRNKKGAISSAFVNPQVQNSNSFLEDLRRLNQLKDSPYQSDIFVEKVNQPKPKQPQILTKVNKLKR